MSDIFILKYLQKTIDSETGAEEWRVFKGKQSEGIDLAQSDFGNSDLHNYDFSGANLSTAKFYNANLAGADFTKANLSYANLNRADLSGSCLNGADLSGGNLESINAVKTDFTGARMSGCKLRGAHLAGAIFTGANLENADLTGANLKYANLLGANLKGTVVEEAILIQCKMDEEAKAGLRGFSSAILEEGQPRPSRAKAVRANTAGAPSSQESARKILNVGDNAERREIQKAYRKLAMQYHPDRVQHLGEKLRKVAEEEFQRVQKAYELLTDETVAAQAEAEQKKASREYSLHELLQLSKQHPNNDLVFYNLGRKFYEAGMLDRAIGAYEKAIQLNPDNQYAAHNLRIAKLTQTLGKKK